MFELKICLYCLKYNCMSGSADFKIKLIGMSY